VTDDGLTAKQSHLRAARQGVRVRIEARRHGAFVDQFVAYSLANELARRGYGVDVGLVGGDSHDAIRRRRQMRLVTHTRTA
jgi:hypothetical protein